MAGELRSARQAAAAAAGGAAEAVGAAAVAAANLEALLDDAGDAADVAHRVLEEHEVHRSVLVVVFRQGTLQDRGQGLDCLTLVVAEVVRAFGKVAENEI